jgi:hypothetical protein
LLCYIICILLNCSIYCSYLLIISVLNGPKEFLDSYKANISPLVQQVERGENAMLIFNGVPFMDPVEYLTTRNGRNGFISMAADQLLKTAVSGRHKSASVTFSWYKVECSSSEAITDLLRAASTPNTAKGPDPNLVLREVGRGKGMFVSGLWEVELAAGSDIASVVAHVTKLVPGCGHSGAAHSVFQLSLNHIKQSEGNKHNTSTQSMLAENAPSRLTFVLLSSLAPPTPARQHGQTEHAPSPAYPWVDQLSELLVWMGARRPSPPFHRSRVLLLLRDAICGRMPCAMYYLLQPTVPAVPENCLWLQLCYRIRDIIGQRTAPTQASPARAVSAAGPAPGSVGVGDAPQVSSHMLYPAANSPRNGPAPAPAPSPGEAAEMQADFSLSMGMSASASVGAADQHGRDGAAPRPLSSQGRGHALPGGGDREREREDLSFEALRRRSAELAARHDIEARQPQPAAEEDGGSEGEGEGNYETSGHYPGGPGGGSSRGGGGAGVVRRGQGSQYSQSQSQYNTSDDEPFQFLPSPPPPGPPPASADGDGGAPAAAMPTFGQFSGSQKSRRHTAPDAADAAREAIRALPLPRQEQAWPQAGAGRGSSGEGGHSSAAAADDARRRSSGGSNAGAGAGAGAGADSLMNRREERAREQPAPAAAGGAGAGAGTLQGLEPSDLEALLEALHTSREENRAAGDALAEAEERGARLTREYERLVASVQEEGYFLRAKEREKFKKALQDLRDYEVYRQVMETAMAKMQTELDLLVKENKAIKEDNLAQDRHNRRLKTDGAKAQKIQGDCEREAGQKASEIIELHERLSVRAKERDVAVESLTQLKIKTGKRESDMSSRLKTQAEEIKELSAKLEAAAARGDAAEAARAALEDSSKEEVEKFREAHLAALDKCMGYQEENDLLRASVRGVSPVRVYDAHCLMLKLFTIFLFMWPVLSLLIVCLLTFCFVRSLLYRVCLCSYPISSRRRRAR